MLWENLPSTRSNGEFQFVLKAGNHETILTGEGYTGKAGCLNGIESVKKNSTSEGNYEKKVSANGKYYFTLRPPNGQVIGTSEMYEFISGRDNGIDSVMGNVPVADVEEKLL